MCIIPIRFLDRVDLEGDFRTKIGGDLGVLEDCIARSDFVLINFEKGRRATLVEQVANDGYKLIPLVDDGGGLVDYGYFFFDDRGDVVGSEALDQKIHSGLTTDGGLDVVY